MSLRSPYARESDSIAASLGSSEESPKNRVHPRAKAQNLQTLLSRG